MQREGRRRVDVNHTSQLESFIYLSGSGMRSSVDKFKSTSSDRCELGKYTDGEGELKAGFHMIADDRGSRIAESSAIVCDHMETHFCDRLRSCDRDRRRSQKIEPCSIFCDRLRSFAILRSYRNQSSAICDRNVSHNIFNSHR